MTEKDTIYTNAPDGKLVEIKNWRQRRDTDDKMIATPLDDTQIRFVERHRQAGYTDTEIFDRLHSGDRLKKSDAVRPVSVKLESLSKVQLADIVENLLGTDLGSVTKLKKDDLIELVRKLSKNRRIHIDTK